MYLRSLFYDNSDSQRRRFIARNDFVLPRSCKTSNLIGSMDNSGIRGSTATPLCSYYLRDEFSTFTGISFTELFTEVLIPGLLSIPLTL